MSESPVCAEIMSSIIHHSKRSAGAGAERGDVGGISDMVPLVEIGDHKKTPKFPHKSCLWSPGVQEGHSAG